MSRVIQARLDEETDALREQLQRRHGWNNSQIVREAIKALAVNTVRRRRRKIIGQGKYQSGVGDLASNPRHMEGFGK